MDRILKYTLFIIIGVFVQTAKTQNLAFYFELIPDSQLPHLRPDMLKGMVGMYELGKRPATVPNLLNGTCTLDTLSSDFLSMHTSDVSTLSIKMLPVESDTTSILAVVHTVKAAGTEDSSINIFTNTWSCLNTEKYFSVPTFKDFFQENEEVTFEEFTKLCIPLLIKYTIAEDYIFAEIDPEKFLTVESYKKILPALRKKPVKYKWNGERYGRICPSPSISHL